MSSAPTHRIVVAGCNGRVGRLFSRLLAASGRLHAGIDIAMHGGDAAPPYIVSDILAPSPAADAALQSADGLLLCLPQDVALAAIPVAASRLRPASLWVDTCSVKTGLCAALSPLTERCEVLSINPMAAPEAGLRNQPVAAVRVRTGPLTHSFLQWLENEGARPVEVSAQDHDRITASVQVATHAALLAFGAALARLDYPIESALRLWTPPHEVLLLLLGRMTASSPAVYWEIQHDHPHGSQVRQELLAALRAVIQAAESDGAEEMARLNGEIRACIAPEADNLARRCAELLARLRAE